MTHARKESRKKLMAFTSVFEAQQKRLLGYIVDLTLKGAMVTGEKVLDVNRQFSIHIAFPEDTPDLKTTNIVIPARVAWCRQDESPKYFDIGFEFTEVSTENTRIIEAVLERYQFSGAVDGSDSIFL